MNDHRSRVTGPGQDEDALSARTRLIHSGSSSAKAAGLLNPPVHRASTIVYETVEDYIGRHSRLYDGVIYGLYGTETAFALAGAITELERGYDTVVTSSGTAAISLSFSAFLKAGDHALIIDTVYRSTRRFCDEVLAGYGIEISYFEPEIGGGIADLIRPNTRVIFLESPGSLTFEMADIPAITAVARANGIVTMLDNTWATPLFFRPIEHGVDVSISAATKYLSGHSDVMLGTMAASNEEVFKKLKDAAARWGNCVSADDCYLVHRGLRTLDVRLERHQQNAMTLIEWFQEQPEVDHILYPALPSDPGHAIWKRDFDGASGLFGVLLDGMSGPESSAFFNHLSHFKLGASWGGFESLMVPAWPAPVRSCIPVPEGALIRVHAGLEATEDLVADLEAAFGRLRHGRDARAGHGGG
ncbi:cystathionine beta-lyase [Sphingosinicella sp. LHD-64]|uniref:cystathionine beta-lyase n=1 Tax=Sphingosinicella sp. LHD-64 TaxID=3072139 RepID=UPI00280E4C10|nr:cystathionine beta-lyase [Sphingosinicella sp. LHD-64]MDQ8757373.1 cystathionine beta-lyase [Sphingosinicella sp. LHD-64]